jgi:hypothetical protein
MASYEVSWSVNVECEGGHKAAAQLVAARYFADRIAAGEQGSSCSFVVVSEADQVKVDIDLADSLSEFEGDDTL